jgi:FixJ family two-component response regulator
VNEELLIAVVDDEESIRKALSRLLRASGFRVETFPSGADFLGSLKNGYPDLVILDLHMPGLSGFEIQGAINALVRTVPVIVITGHDSPETRQRVLAGRAAAYLRKPIDEHLLFRAISDATGASLPS